MLSEKSHWTQNGTMFVDLDSLLNASSPLSASAELLVSVTLRGRRAVGSRVAYFEQVLCHGLWVDFDTVYTVFFRRDCPCTIDSSYFYC